MKRIIGQPFNDAVIDRESRHWPFVLSEQNGMPVVHISRNGKEEQIKPEYVSQLVLQEVKRVAEANLGKEVNKAVITVPAYFNNLQKEATKRAAEAAGLRVLKLLPEPTAAGMAYGIKDGTYGKKTILVYDLGGGTFDVSIMELKSGKYSVIGIDGDTHLGGDDFDNTLIDWIFENISKEHGNRVKCDIKDDLVKVQKIRKAVREAKHQLAKLNQTKIKIPYLIGDGTFVKVLNRERFNILNSKLFEKTMEIVQRCLDKCDISDQYIDQAVLVGGSTRVRKIQEMVKEKFPERVFDFIINPDEAVAIGAAQMGALATDTMQGKFQGLRIQEVIPLSIGTPVDGGTMSVEIEKNTRVPTEKTTSRVNMYDQQPNFYFQIYEGESVIAEENTKVGGFTFDVTPRPPGKCNVFLTFKIDDNGILSLTATEQDTGRSKNYKITERRGDLSEEDRDRMIAKARANQEKDRAELEKMEAESGLKTICKNYISFANRGKFPTHKKSEIIKKCEENQNWIKTRKGREAVTSYKQRTDEIKNLYESLLPDNLD